MNFSEQLHLGALPTLITRQVQENLSWDFPIN